MKKSLKKLAIAKPGKLILEKEVIVREAIKEVYEKWQTQNS